MMDMHGQDVGQMVENWQDRLWEELNASDSKFENWYPAISKLREAVTMLHQAGSKLERAAEWTEGTGEEHRIAALAEAADEFADQIIHQIFIMENNY